MFRGYLMNLFSQKSNYHNGIAISALIFAFVHFNFSNFFYYFVLGVVMGYVYYWGKNLFYPILIHFLNNALVVFGYLYSISNEVTDELSHSYTLMPYITLGLSLLIFYLNFKRNKHIIQQSLTALMYSFTCTHQLVCFAYYIEYTSLHLDLLV